MGPAKTIPEAKLVLARALMTVQGISEDYLEGEDGQFHIAVLSLLVAQFLARFPESRHDEVLADLLQGVSLTVKGIREHMEEAG